MPKAAAKPRQRVSAAERRDALIDAAIEEFSVSGLHGTPVERIARRVGVTQPYVFSLFATKRDLFIAAIERCFETVSGHFSAAAAEALEEAAARAAAAAEAGEEPDESAGNPVLGAIGSRYIDLLGSDRSMLMSQLQAYSACDDEIIREHVRRGYTALFERVKELAGVDDAEATEFMSFGAYLTIQAAMGGADLVGLKASRGAMLEERQAAVFEASSES